MNDESRPESLVMWADAHLLIVNKPAGLPTLSGGWAPAPHVRGILEPVYGKLWIVHRLDRQTSGVLALARTAEAHRSLNLQFDAHSVVKIYHALVVGSPDWAEHVVALPLRADDDRKHRTVVDLHRGKPSVTGLRVLERLGAFALIEAIPQTGRTHQIRAHLAALGHPIVGDVLYGGKRAAIPTAVAPDFGPGHVAARPSLQRPGLHAWSLTLQHPATGEVLTFEAPYPDDLAEALRSLRAVFDPLLS